MISSFTLFSAMKNEFDPKNLCHSNRRLYTYIYSPTTKKEINKYFLPLRFYISVLYGIILTYIMFGDRSNNIS